MLYIIYNNKTGKILSVNNTSDELRLTDGFYLTFQESNNLTKDEISVLTSEDIAFEYASEPSNKVDLSTMRVVNNPDYVPPEPYIEEETETPVTDINN